MQKVGVQTILFAEKWYIKSMKIKEKKKKIVIEIGILILVIVGVAAFLLYDSGDDSIGNQIILSQTAEDTISVSWTSNRKYDGVISWKDGESKARCVEIRKGEYYRYSAQMSGLQKGQSYQYRIGDGTTMSKKRLCVLQMKKNFRSYI